MAQGVEAQNQWLLGLQRSDPERYGPDSGFIPDPLAGRMKPVNSGNIFGNVPPPVPNPMGGVAPFTVGEGDIFGTPTPLLPPPPPFLGLDLGYQGAPVNSGDIFAPPAPDYSELDLGYRGAPVNSGDILASPAPDYSGMDLGYRRAPVNSGDIFGTPTVPPNPLRGMTPMGNILGNIGPLPAPYTGTSGFGGY
jgi:hypothetical protein